LLKKKGDGEHCELKSAQALLLAIPSLDGKVITSDSLHNQKKTAQITVEKGGDYLQQVKDNQKTLHAHLKKSFAGIPPVYGSPEKGHGRIEQRAIAVVGTNAMKSSFPHARSLIAIWSRRIGAILYGPRRGRGDNRSDGYSQCQQADRGQFCIILFLKEVTS